MSATTLHPSMLHPLTGLPLHPVGVRRDGRLIWPVMGGAPDGGDGGGDGGSGDGGDGGSGSGDSGGTGGTGGTGDGTQSGSGQQQGQQAGQQQTAEKVEDLPEWAQKIIRETRDEAAKNRTGKTAAEEQQQKILKAVAQAAGLKVDDGDDAPNAEQLAEQLTATQAQAREAAAELIVWRNHESLKVDAQALTDSKAFAGAIKDLDPSSETFEADVKKAAEKAAENNPKLKATQAVGSSSADHAGGSGAGSAPRKPKPLAEAVSGHYGTS